MNRKIGLVFVLFLTASLALDLSIRNPFPDYVRKGYVGVVAFIAPSENCRAWGTTLNATLIKDERGNDVYKEISKVSMEFRGVSTSSQGEEVDLDHNKGLWSGFFDGSNEKGVVNLTVETHEFCPNGTAYMEGRSVVFRLDAPEKQTGLKGQLDRAGQLATSVIISVFGVDLSQIVNPNAATTLIDEFGGLSFPLLIFGFILPFILTYAILYDMFFLVGFFRPSTSRIIALIIAILFARMQGFGALYSILFNVFANFWISMLSLLFTMMVLYWVLGHLIWGYRFAKEIQTQTDAMSYLDKVGKHLDKLQKSGGK